MTKISNIDARISKLTSELDALKKEKETLDEKNSLVVSDFVLPPELEAIAGWICQVNKKDFFVQIFDSDFGNGSYLILSDGIDFYGSDAGCPFSKFEEIAYEGYVRETPAELNRREDVILIPIPESDNRNNKWFISRFCWTDSGYVIEKIPVNSKTGEVCEQYFKDFN